MSTPFSFLAMWPGSFLYHLVTLLVIEAGLGVAWDMYRRTNRRAGWEFGLCFAGLVIGRLFQVGIIFSEDLTPPLLADLSRGDLVGELVAFGATLLVMWAFVLPDAPRSSVSWKRYFFAFHIGGGLSLSAIFIMWPALAASEVDLVWQTMIWQFWQVLLYTLALGLLVRRPPPHASTPLLIALTAFWLGYLLRLIFPASADGLGLARFGELVGYLFLLVVVYQAVFQNLSPAAAPPAPDPIVDFGTHRAELQAYKSELQAISQEAMYRQEEMIFLLETSRAVNSSLELQTVLHQTAQYIALAIRADAAVIALRQPEAPQVLRIVTGYDPLSKKVWEASQIQLAIDRYPLLRQAMQCEGEAIIIQNSEPSAELLTLHAALGSSDIGPLLIQPLCHRGEALGVLMLGNARRQNLFSYSDGWLCQSMADQVNGAIVNARLYDEVTSLLEQRQTEVSQRQAILDSVTEGVVVADRANKVLMVNPAATKFLQRPARSLLGQPLTTVCSALADTDYAVFEMEALTIAASLSPVYLPDNSLLGKVAVLRDVTREREAERAKSRFIETVSHELRTPLTAVKGYADLLLKGTVPPGSKHYERFMRTIKTNTERLLVIVNNMIAVSEMDGKRSLILQSMQVAAVLEEALARIQVELKQRNLTLVRQLRPDLPPSTGDPLRLRQVFDNLLSNALRYTPAGGKITAATTFIPPEESEGGGFIKITIADTGIGIPAAELERIFDRFYRAENSLQVEAGGPGVGLTVARDIVEQHGGYIWMTSRAGRGSKVNIVLPVLGPEAARPQPSGEPALTSVSLP